MRGFSLIELTIASALGVLILTCTLHISAAISESSLTQRRRMATHANLSMAASRLRADLEELEPEFWREFPARADENLVHASERVSGPVRFSPICPQQKKTACIQFRDLASAGAGQLYRLVASDWPHQIELQAESGSPQTRPDAGSVLLSLDPSATTPLLIGFRSGELCYLAEADQSPWSIPEHAPAPETRLIQIGQLRIQHHFLRQSHDLAYQLFDEFWLLKAGRWSPDRAYSSFGYLRELRLLTHEPGQPRQLLLVAGSPDMDTLAEPLELGGSSYSQEVQCATLSL